MNRSVVNLWALKDLIHELNHQYFRCIIFMALKQILEFCPYYKRKLNVWSSLIKGLHNSWKFGISYSTFINPIKFFFMPSIHSKIWHCQDHRKQVVVFDGLEHEFCIWIVWMLQHEHFLADKIIFLYISGNGLFSNPAIWTNIYMMK